LATINQMGTGDARGIKLRQSVRAGCDRPLEMAKGNPLV
jgi:hypothetical protein